MTLLPVKHPNFDSVFSAWLVCVAAAGLVTAILYPFLRVVMQQIRDGLAGKRIQQKVLALRGQESTSNVRVRQTDLLERLSPAGRAQWAQAEALLAQGHIREAALLFEAIRCQRRAVDILEKAQLIDEACAVLMRLKVPNRAASLYERNGRLEDAAKLFTAAGEDDHAARIYSKLAQQDYRFAPAAAEAFQRLGKTEDCLASLALLLSTESIVAMCLGGEHLEFLAHYARGRKLVSEVFGRLPPTRFAGLCAALGQSPLAMSILASWTECQAAQPALLEILRQATMQQDLAKVFTDHLTEAACYELQQNLARIDLPAVQLGHLEFALQASAPRTCQRKSA